jgi:signal transduction histidine kinase
VWNEPWSGAAATAAILALLWLVHRFRVRRITREFHLRLDERLNERTRIARELHDTLLQSFQGSLHDLRRARDLLPAQPDTAGPALDGALDRADLAIVEARDAIQNLRASSAGTSELADAISAFVEELSRNPDAVRAPGRFRLCIEGSPRALHPMVREDVQRIAREALRNAFRHSEAARIEAEITYGARQIRLRIRDDGKGIDPRQLTAGHARHWGLCGMRDRVLQLGGRLDLWSEVGAGTEVELRIPGAVAYGGRRRLLQEAEQGGC